MTTYVFPGQGSQKKGMGEGLFDRFYEITKQTDEILGYSIKDLCLNDSEGNLAKTQYTQPALYTVNVLSYLNHIEQNGQKPDYVAGHSLGEYNALFVAGAFDFQTGLKLVQKRGELMGCISGGGMAAILGLSESQIQDALLDNNLINIDIANYNSTSQIVISGLKADIDRASAVFEKIDGVIMVIPLNTSGAFHSRYMEDARRDFEDFVTRIEFQSIQIPVISNLNARPYRQADIIRNLTDQITHSVKWTDSIRYLMGLGEYDFVELGNGQVLTNLIGKIVKEAEPLIINYTEEVFSDEKDKEYKEDLFVLTHETKGTVESKLTDSSEPIFALITEGSNSTEYIESSVSGFPVTGLNKHVETEVGANKGDSILNVDVKVPQILPTTLGCIEFKKDYNLTYAYMSGGMYKGISSKDLVVRMGKAGMMGYLGAGGLKLSRIEREIRAIQSELSAGQPFGVDVVHIPTNPGLEEQMVDLYLSLGVKHVEAAAFLNVTPALIKFKARGLSKDSNGNVVSGNTILAKVSRPEVAEVFLSPPSDQIIVKLIAEGKISQEEAELLGEVPIADDVCVESDSGGHTDGGVAYALMPTMLRLRDELATKHGYRKKVRIGAAGGIGTPEAAAAAFLLGADFIMTGSVNQCTVEAGTSDVVKDLLQAMNVQDTEYVPAGDMFELGAKVQVLKKGLFFPARANKLYDLYRHHQSIDELDEKTKIQLQEKYFKRTFEQIYEDCVAYHPSQEILKAERNPKHKMALIFKWYFGYATRQALNGIEASRVDYQIPCGPALGAFNQWVKGTRYEDWRSRHADEIGLRLMEGAADLLQLRYQKFLAICN